MTELAKGSTELAKDDAANSAANLLIHYSFDLSGLSADLLISGWLRQHQANWVRLAVIEALYQGRYKAVSVEQILAFWHRRGQPLYHFNHEFERLVSSKLPQNLVAKPELTPEVSSLSNSVPIAPLDLAQISPLVNNPSLAVPEIRSVIETSLESHRDVTELISQISAPEQVSDQIIPSASQPTAPLTEMELPLPSVEPTPVMKIPSRSIPQLNQEPVPPLSETGEVRDRKSIPQFTPTANTSPFYDKLKSVADHNQVDGIDQKTPKHET